jgi:hypothetical protein
MLPFFGGGSVIQVTGTAEIVFKEKGCVDG